jgi:gas vesicle protein
MRQDTTRNVLWFLAGVGIGTAVGVITAPKSGSETRHLLASSGREYYERGRELYERGREFADEAAGMYDEGRRLVEDARQAEASS